VDTQPHRSGTSRVVCFVAGRRVVFLAAVLLMAAVVMGRVAAQDHLLFTDPAAENLFRYSRMAIGTGPAIAGLRSLVFIGHSRVQIDGNGPLTPAAVQIKFLLPDNYLRIDTIDTAQRRAGFSGNTVLSSIRDGENVTYPPDNIRKQILRNGRFHVVRFLLGALTYATPELVLTFHSIPKSVEMIDPRVSPRTTTTVDTSGNLEPYTANVTGEGFDARFIVDSSTRTPRRIEFTAADKHEMVMKFDQRRLVAGLQLPFHIVTTNGGRVVDELTFDEIIVNAELGKRDFVP
jgi:hypothetical protein